MASMIKISNDKTPTDDDMLVIGRGRSLRGTLTPQITQTTSYQRLGLGLIEEKSEGEVEKGLRAIA